MNDYILLHKANSNDSYSAIEGEAETEVSFIEQLAENTAIRTVLQEDDWVVYEVVRGTHKDEYIYSGELDHII